MSDQPFTITATRSQLTRAMLDLISDVDLSDDGPGAGHAVDVFLHYLDPQQFPVHPDQAPVAVATGPTSFQPAYPGALQYTRADSDFVLLLSDQQTVVRVLGPAPFPSGSLAVRPVVHTVAVIDGDVDDAIAAASAAVDHMSGR
jgi:hypothetical protein